MIEKPIDQIVEDDLRALVTEKRPEGRRIDYKRDLDISKDAEKKELARDVSAFANAGGGDLIFGIEEQKDADGKNLGIPKDVVGVVCPNFDQTKQRIEAIVRDNVEPRIQGLTFRIVDGFANGPVIVLRVPASWSGPHMVTSTSSNFWSRNNTGRQALDVHEIRSAFVAGGEAAAAIQDFRNERIGKIIADETPVRLEDGGKARVVIHLVPVARERPSIDLHRLDRLLAPPAHSGWNHHYNLDGFVAFSGRSGEPQYSYAQAFRDGRLEGVSCGHRRVTHDERPPELYGLQIEKVTIETIETFRKVLRSNRYSGPVCVMLTLLRVRGTRLTHANDMFLRPSIERVVIDRDVLVLPDILLTDETLDVQTAMKPVFDALWQAGGHPGTPST